MGYHKEINPKSLKPLQHANDQQTLGIANQKIISSMSGTILILTETLSRSPSSKLLCFESHIFASYAVLPCSQTDGTSQRQTPRTLSRTPITPDTPDSLELGIHEVSSDDDEELKKTRGSTSWGTQEHPAKKAR